MNELALYILDLTQNSVTAGATCVEIRVTIDHEADSLLIEIIDDGTGDAAYQQLREDLALRDDDVPFKCFEPKSVRERKG